MRPVNLPIHRPSLRASPVPRQDACEYNVRWSRRTQVRAIPAGHPARTAVWRAACGPECVASVGCRISLQNCESENIPQPRRSDSTVRLNVLARFDVRSRWCAATRLGSSSASAALSTATIGTLAWPKAPSGIPRSHLRTPFRSVFRDASGHHPSKRLRLLCSLREGLGSRCDQIFGSVLRTSFVWSG